MPKMVRLLLRISYESLNIAINNPMEATFSAWVGFVSFSVYCGINAEATKKIGAFMHGNMVEKKKQARRKSRP